MPGDYSDCLKPSLMCGSHLLAQSVKKEQRSFYVNLHNTKKFDARLNLLFKKDYFQKLNMKDLKKQKILENKSSDFLVRKDLTLVNWW